MQSVNVPVKTHEDFLTDYVTAILEEDNPEPELLASALDDVAIALGGEGDREWVKDFGASDKSQAVYELAAWLDSLGLRLTVEKVQKVDR